MSTAAAAETSKVDDEPLRGEVKFDYLTARGEPECTGVGEATWVPFERCAPVRGFTFRKGQRHLPGRWWSATDFAHVGYESWLERDHLMLLDFDPAVVAIARNRSGCPGPARTGRPGRISPTSSCAATTPPPW